MIYVATGWRVLVPDLSQLLRGETAGDPNQRRPEPTVNQGDLAIDEPTNKDLIGFGNGSNDCVDLTTLRVCPPATFDWFADDGFREARSGPLGGNEDDAIFSDECQRLLSREALAHDAQR